MRDRPTQNLYETCVTFGGKGREISGREGDDRRVIRNVYEYGYVLQVRYLPPLDGKTGQAGIRQRK